jgi:chemotaxis-related protein WspD
MNDRHPATPGSDRTHILDCWNKIGVWGDGSCPELVQHVHCRNCPVYSQAAVSLLQREPSAGYVEECTKHFAAGKHTDVSDLPPLVLFRIGAEWLALPAAVFKEIASPRTIHSLPHRRDGVVLGLVNVRGELLVCVSLGEVLGLDKTPPPHTEAARSGHRRLVVISRDGCRVAFQADEVHGIQHVSRRDLKEVPSTVVRAAATYTRAMLPWREKAVGCLDDQLLFHTLARSLA